MHPLETLLQAISDMAGAAIALLTNSSLGNFASLLGAAISLGVLFTVSDLRKKVLFRVRAPDAVKDLAERAASISSLLNDFDANLPAISREIALAEVTLRNVEEKLDAGELRKTLRKAIGKIGTFRSRASSARAEEPVRDIYIELLVSAKAISNLIADFREEPK